VAKAPEHGPPEEEQSEREEHAISLESLVVTITNYGEESQLGSLLAKVAAATLLSLIAPLRSLRHYTSASRAHRSSVLNPVFHRRLPSDTGFVEHCDILLVELRSGPRAREVSLVLRYYRKRSRRPMQAGSGMLGFLNLRTSPCR